MEFPGVNDAQVLVNKLLRNDLQLKTSYQALLQCLSTVVDEVTCVYRQAQGKLPYFNKIYLCASQLKKVLETLGSTLQFYENYQSYKENNQLVLGRIEWCLKEIGRITRGRGTDDDLEPREKFVDLIDSIINGLHCGKFDTATSMITDLVQEALVIAIFSSNSDKEEIMASCKNVLACSSYGKDYMSSSSSIFGPELLLRALENLERHVNTSMLRLCLHIFSDFHSHYKKITVKALKKSEQPKAIEDLEEDFEALDIFCDKIQLIGRFAMACSADRSAKLKIQCSLASIEFCGNQFERAASACYLQQQSGNNNYLKLIVSEYLKETKSLQMQMNHIIDTPTFMQVIYDDLNCLYLSMKKEDASQDSNHDIAKIFSSRCYVAVIHLRTTDDALVHSSQVKGAIKEFEEAVKYYASTRQSVTQIKKTSWDAQSWAEWILRSLEKLCQVFDQLQEASFSFSSTPIYKMGTPFCKIKNESRSNVVQCTAAPDVLNDSNVSSALLTPFLNKIKETPRVQSVLYGTTPKKIWRKTEGSIRHSKYEPRALLVPETCTSAVPCQWMQGSDSDDSASVDTDEFDIFDFNAVKKAAEEVLLLDFTSTNLTSSA